MNTSKTDLAISTQPLALTEEINGQPKLNLEEHVEEPEFFGKPSYIFNADSSDDDSSDESDFEYQHDQVKTKNLLILAPMLEGDQMSQDSGEIFNKARLLISYPLQDNSPFRLILNGNDGTIL